MSLILPPLTRRCLVVSRADMPMRERGKDIVKRLEEECLESNNDDLVGFVNGVFRHVRAYHSRKAQLESLAEAYPQDISQAKAREDYTKGCRFTLHKGILSYLITL